MFVQTVYQRPQLKPEEPSPPSSNGLPAINNPSFYSPADQTKFIILVHMFCMHSELEIHATERIAHAFKLARVHVRCISIKELLSATLSKRNSLCTREMRRHFCNAGTAFVIVRERERERAHEMTLNTLYRIRESINVRWL